MGEPFARVPHTILEGVYNPKKRMAPNDMIILAYMYADASHPVEKRDGVMLEDGHALTSYEIAANCCGLTKKQARVAFEHLQSMGHIKKCTTVRGESKKQYTLYAVTGLYDRGFYDKKASSRAGEKPPVFAENQKKIEEEKPPGGQAVGQALPAKGQAENIEIPVFSDAGGPCEGTQYIDINNTVTKGSNIVEVYREAPPAAALSSQLVQTAQPSPTPPSPQKHSWATLTMEEQEMVLERVRTGASTYAAKAEKANGSKRDRLRQMADNFTRWHTLLQHGTPQEKEKAYEEYMASSIKGE